MLFYETIDNYIATKELSSRSAYINKITSFYNFLSNEKNINDNNFIVYLSAMTTKEIIEGLSYFIEHNDIKKQSVAFHYSCVIKGYFDFLYDLGVENTKLIKETGYKNTNPKSYFFQINNYIEKHPQLIIKESKDALDFEDIKLLIDECDNGIKEILSNQKEYIARPTKRKKPYNTLVYLLSLKLMIFAGTKYSSIRILPLSCFDMNKHKITINTFTIHLPDNLCTQLKLYIALRDEFNIKSDYLFSLRTGEQLKEITSGLSDCLKQFIGRSDTVGIIKYVVIEMIKKGINQNFIMRLTGIGPDIFQDCQDFVNKEKHFEANRYIDSQLRDMITFDYL